MHSAFQQFASSNITCAALDNRKALGRKGQATGCGFLGGGPPLHGGGDGAQLKAGQAMLEYGRRLCGAGRHGRTHVLPKLLPAGRGV